MSSVSTCGLEEANINLCLYTGWVLTEQEKYDLCVYVCQDLTFCIAVQEKMCCEDNMRPNSQCQEKHKVTHHKRTV